MTYIIYSYDHPRSPGVHYFCGVFQKEEVAKEYLASISDEYRKNCRLESFSEFSYPLYLIEEDFYQKPAIPITRADLAKKMAMMPKVDDENHEYFNYYLFVDDYRGIIPGEDCLGMTDHHHVDNHHIQCKLNASLERQENRAIDRAASLDDNEETYEEMLARLLQGEEKLWVPSEDDKKLQRYGFLFGKPRLTTEENSEKKTLLAELRALGRDPGWELS